MKNAYETTIGLNHDEVPAKINKRTGEVTEIKQKVFLQKKTKDNKNKKFDLFPVFQRINTKAWQLLESQVTKNELAVATKLALRAEAYTNSLKPLNPDSTITFIAEYLDDNRKTIMRAIDKLFKLGVIAKFEVYEADEVHKKYWVFNPYLSFNGKHIGKDLVSLFDNTFYAKMMK